MIDPQYKSLLYALRKQSWAKVKCSIQETFEFFYGDGEKLQDFDDLSRKFIDDVEKGDLLS